MIRFPKGQFFFGSCHINLTELLLSFIPFWKIHFNQTKKKNVIKGDSPK